MDDNYNPADQLFQERVGESLSLAVNLLADVIYTISEAAGIPEFRRPITMLGLALLALIVAVRTGPARRKKGEQTILMI